MPGSSTSDFSAPYHVAIVGAGFSGSMLAIQVAAGEGEPRVALIERTRSFGPGLAYGAAGPEHLLNVPVGKMSAFPDQPSHFLEWLEHNPAALAAFGLENVQPGDFVPRALYGRYLSSLVTDAAKKHPNLQLIDAEAVDIERIAEGGSVVRLAGGEQLQAENIVLAWGNSPPTAPAAVDQETKSAANFIHNPWSSEARDALAQPEDILILGSGLTCLDLLATAKKIGRSGRIHVLSRHGYFPQAHRAAPVCSAFLDENSLPQTTREIFAIVRRQIQKIQSEGGDWRSVIDCLRPYTQDLWRGLNAKERRRFLRHVRPLWESLRHRAAPEIRSILDEMEKRGQVIRHSGRLVRITKSESGMEILFRSRRLEAVKRIEVKTVINATGPEIDPRRSESPLLKNLLARGLARADALGLGIEVSQNLADDPLHIVGNLRKGALWESTAVPELRVQAAELAKRLLSSHRPASIAAEPNAWFFEI